MEKELGKWLMDIAKYILTVIVLSKFFSGTTISAGMFAIAIMAVIVTLFGGMYLINKNK
jgi:hypothetical protein